MDIGRGHAQARQRKPKAGSMKNHRGIITTVTLMGLVLTIAPPASASSLLSGYGGPGQGNQAILGSALINGPSGGGGGTSGSGGSGGSAGGESGASQPTSSTAPGSAPGGSAKGTAQPRSGKAGSGKPGNASGKGSPAHTSTTVPVAPQSATGGSPALGLSGADVLYILLAAAALVATGLLTRQIARRPG